MTKYNLKNVKNVNSGIDPARIQEEKPCHFVNWQDEDGNHYEFFPTVSGCESFKNRLLTYEIEDEFKRMGQSLSETMPFSQGQNWVIIIVSNKES